LTVPVGLFANALIVDPVTNTVFVTNQGTAGPGTLSVIDGNSCNATNRSGCAAQPEASVNVGDGPSGIGINPVTNTIYVTNTGPGNPIPDGHTVSVIDGARCRAGDLSGCSSIGTVPVGLGPVNLTVDPTTNTIYLGDTYPDTAGRGFITLINGATCDAADQAGCGSAAHPIVAVGADPIGYAVDPNNNSVYVTNASDDTVSVIDDTKCSAKRSAGCENLPPTIAVSGAPSWPVVDPATHTIYVVDQADNDVAILNDQGCDAETTYGCRHPVPSVPAGSFPNAATTDTRFGTIYVGDAHAFQPPYTISMIDAARCNASELSRCERPPRTLSTAGRPFGMAADQGTNTVYVATDGPLQVIDAATCNATTSIGCEDTASVPAGGHSVAVDQSTDTIYTVNNHPDGSGYISVIDGRRCNGADTSGCARQTATTVPTVAVGNQIAFGITAPTVDRTPDRLAVDDGTHTLYVTNAGDQTVSVIDITHCRAGDASRCASLQPATVPLPNALAPVAIAVDSATNTAYVADNPFPAFPGSMSLIDTTHCRAGDTSQCASQTPPRVPTPAGAAFRIQVDPTTNRIYVANLNDSSVSVIDGNQCNANDTVGCSRIPKIEVGSNPSDLTLDLANRTAYMPNFYDNDASVFAIVGGS
jgi:DNA-binding beta-propeller fold protein YncE